MIVCPNCNHQNPDGAIQCEACYTPLPATTNCPNCGAAVQTDASFCGQCGFSLKAAASMSSNADDSEAKIVPPLPDVPELVPPDPVLVPDAIAVAESSKGVEKMPVEVGAAEENLTTGGDVEATPSPVENPAATGQMAGGDSRTQLQQHTARLLHVQTNSSVELPQQLSVVHIGKPNDRIPPDIDVSGFPNSEIVSRIHADIRVEGDAYFIEDVGSSNGTYINNLPLSMGNRHRLRPGDRIALGKGDKVTFLFQVS